MSNYLVIHAERPRYAAIDRWLEEHARHDEVHHVHLSWRRRLTIVAPRVMDCVNGSAFFRGVAVTPHSLILGVQGWVAATSQERADASDHAGTFVTVRWGDSAVTVDRDLYGNVRLLTTVARGMVAASDSLMVLGSLRRALRATLSLNERALHARSVLPLVAGQQLSPDTYFKQVRFVPAGFGVKLTMGAPSIVGTPMAQRVSHVGDYRDSVREAAETIAKVTAAAASVPHWTAELSLSGGYDSRVIVAAQQRTSSHLVATSARYSSVHSADYAVARDLSAQLGLTFGRSEPVQPDGPTSDQLAVWGAAHAGVYDGFGARRTRRWHPRTININGMGAETAKGNWNFARWSDVVARFIDPSDKHVTPSGARAFNALGIRGIKSVGGDPESPTASELLYLGYRSGIHAAAGQISINMTSVMPLQTMALTRLGYTMRGTQPHGDATIISDLSLLLDRNTATFRYDLPERNITESFAESRLEALGGPITTVGETRILGTPEDVPDGPTSLSLSIAHSLGITGELSVDAVFARCNDDIDLLPSSELRDIYRLIADNGRWMIGKRNGDLLSAGVSPPKTASLALLRLLQP